MNSACPLFTIATITYNSEKWVKEAIESILSSSYSDFELLISDDCSTDNTWDVIKKYNDPRIRAWRNESNVGEYPNRNKVLNEAKGRYLLFVDGDDILYKETLTRIAEYAAYFPNAAAFWGVAEMDTLVFPYELNSDRITKLIFLSKYEISNYGFGESIFKVDILKEIGGFKINYTIGDTFIKKRIACSYPVVLTSLGYTFWRQLSNQASKNSRKNFKHLIEGFNINSEILLSDYFPLNAEEKMVIQKNIRISIIKLLFTNTVLKGNLIQYVKLLRTLNLSIFETSLIFKEIRLDYTLDTDCDHPLLNNFNFTNRDANL